MTDPKWVGFDFDGTLTTTLNWDGTDDGSIGEHIRPMIERVQAYLDAGVEVRIVTARVARGWDKLGKHWLGINQWAFETFGVYLPITSEKDPMMLRLYDDRAVQLIPNTGVMVEEALNTELSRARLEIAELSEIKADLMETITRIKDAQDGESE